MTSTKSEQVPPCLACAVPANCLHAWNRITLYMYLTPHRRKRDNGERGGSTGRARSEIQLSDSEMRKVCTSSSQPGRVRAAVAQRAHERPDERATHSERRPVAGVRFRGLPSSGSAPACSVGPVRRGVGGDRHRPHPHTAHAIGIHHMILRMLKCNNSAP